MERHLKRRQFLTRSVLLGGGLMLAAGEAAAGMGKAPPGFDKIDAGLFRQINRVKDAKNKSLLEKKHAPLIEAPDTIKAGEPFAVTVTMGEVMHPMSVAHYIAYVELFAGNEPAGRCQFDPEHNLPKAVFHLRLSGSTTLVAREYCNLHGLWESRREIVLG